MAKDINKYVISGISSPIRSSKGIDDFFKHLDKQMSWGIHQVQKKKIMNLIKKYIADYKNILAQNYEKCIGVFSSDQGRNMGLTSLMTGRMDKNQSDASRNIMCPIVKIGEAYDNLLGHLLEIYNKQIPKSLDKIKEQYLALIYGILNNNLISSTKSAAIRSTQGLCEKIFNDYWDPVDQAYDIIKAGYFNHGLYRNAKSQNVGDAYYGFTLVGVNPTEYRDDSGDYLNKYKNGDQLDENKLPKENKVTLPKLSPHNLNQACFMVKNDFSEYIMAWNKTFTLYKKDGKEVGGVSVPSIINGQEKVKSPDMIVARFKKIFG